MIRTILYNIAYWGGLAAVPASIIHGFELSWWWLLLGIPMVAVVGTVVLIVMTFGRMPDTEDD